MNKTLFEKVKKENIHSVLDEKAFYGLVERVTNKCYADFIRVERIQSNEGYDEYEMFDTESGITIKSTSGVCAAVAFNVYLQDVCHYYVGMLTTNGILPENPPKIGKIIKNKSLYLYRYFLNYCTFGYTYAFYTWKDWQKVIDRMLLSGYNLVLNPIGQECVWKELLTELNYTEQEIESFLVAPNFMPWQLMMNFENYKGNYPTWWWKDRIDLANKINKRLQSFGVGIMLCGYSGMVPNDFDKHFPNAKLKDQGTWCGFGRPKYLLYDDKMFHKVATSFYRIQNKLIGKNKVHYFSSDPFHEGGITEGLNLSEFASVAYSAMKKQDENAVWVFQGWGENPRREMLRSIPSDKVLVTNLLADTNGNAGDNYADRPWLYCTVNNFGGQHLLRGSLRSTIEKPYNYVNDKDYTMVGIGLMPEAVENCEVFFDIAFNNAINDKQTLTDDFLRKYVNLHYGIDSENLYKALKILTNKIYVKDDICSSFESPYIACPSLEVDRVANCGNHAKDEYPIDLLKVCNLYYSEYENCKNSKSYLFDYVDTIRQLSANYSWHLVYEMQKAFKNKDKESFAVCSERFLTLLSLQEKLLLSTDMFLYEIVIKKHTDSYGRTKTEKEYFDYLMKTLITVWGDDRTHDQPDANHRLEGILDNYAAREYGDLIRDFYRPRWEMYIKMLKFSLEYDYPFREYNFNSYNNEFCYKEVIKDKVKYNTQEIVKSILDIISENKYLY